MITRGTPCALDHEHDPDRCVVVLTMTRREAVYVATGLKLGARVLGAEVEECDDAVNAYMSPELVAHWQSMRQSYARRETTCIEIRRVLKRLLGTKE